MAASSYGYIGSLEQGSDASTPFRKKEKQYQLHKDQAMKLRGGKLRGGKLTSKPTDFSDVLDLSKEREASAVTVAGCSAHQVEGFARRVYTFKQHPGLMYVPGFLHASKQLELARAALLEYLEPPARTNHSVRYCALPGLWTAAVAGLRLSDPAHTGPSQEKVTADQGGNARGIPCGGPLLGRAAGAQVHGIAGGRGASGGLAARGSELLHAECHREGCNCDERQKLQGGQPTPCSSSCTCTRSSTVSREDATERDLRQRDCGGSSCSSGTWSASGGGVPAEKLLMKLRWATLGPPYNWTTRTYELQAPHRPLPPLLLQLAVDMHALFDRLDMPIINPPVPTAPSNTRPCRLLPCGIAGSGPPDDHTPMQGMSCCCAQAAAAAACCSLHQHPATPPQALSSSVTSPAARRPPPSLTQGAGSPISGACRSRLPDAAIVNYYREGDTLGGHRDDAESSMAHPLISVSLGCCAVFLMGGSSKMEEPTPLMLHSGDVLVMSGAARRCFHGVPRVMAGTLPQELQTQRLAEVDSAILQYLSGGRINISIRTVT